MNCIIGKTIVCVGFTLAAVVSYASPSQVEQYRAVNTIYSYLFKDVIASNGNGDINLFQPRNNKLEISGSILEAFRQDNSGYLVFAVDVNEAADASESSDSQGLAIRSLTLSVTVNGTEYVYDQFFTRTESLLIASGASERAQYYTLIGEGGSGLISPNMDSELTGTSIDSTIWIPIERDLSLATSAQLSIVLLDVATDSGDPEDFYDFSNGFEEIALLTAEDVAYLESLERGIAMAPMVIQQNSQDSLFWSYYPSSGAFYVAAYEDLFPNRGDYDFNDLTVAYQLKVGNDATGNTRIIRGNGYLITRGAEYDHSFYLGIELPEVTTGTVSVSFYEMGQNTPATGFPRVEPFNGRVDALLVANVASHFHDDGSTYVNTFDVQSIVQGPRFEIELLFDAPTPLTLGEQAPFDPYIYVHDTGYEIHTVGNAPVLSFSSNEAEDLIHFKDNNGYPFALILNENWLPPLAGVDMGIAYPEFIDHVNSNGSEHRSWHSSPAAEKVKQVPFVNWQW